MFCGVVFASQPGDEGFGANNPFCNYEKYKNKIPDACPRVDEIVYSFTVYDNSILQNTMKTYAFESINFYRKKSKNNNVSLKLDRSRVLSSRKVFDQSYFLHIPNKNKLIVSFFVRVHHFYDKKFLTINILTGSQKTVKNTLVTSDLLAEDDLEGYLKSVTDEYIKTQLAPIIFPDWSAN